MPRRMPSLGRLRRAYDERRWVRWTANALIVLAVYLGIRAWQTRGAADGAAPPLEARDLDGAPLDLAAMRGEPVLVHFWATWCGVCRAEEDNVESVAADHPVVTVATRSGDRDGVVDYVREHGLSAPVALDPDGRVADAWGVRSLPTSFAVGRDGRIRHVEVGYTTEVGLRARLWLAGL